MVKAQRVTAFHANSTVRSNIKDEMEKGNAEPFPDNEVTYFDDFVSWARDNTVAYYYFEAFDENWKASYEGLQGAHWGVWDAAGNTKNNMSRIFD